ncbi:MAG: diguanylate cyclase [Pseudomonadota bacterium]
MFTDQSFDAPVIHVVSESPRLEMLQARLKQAGIRPVPVRGSYLPPDSAPAFVDLLTRDFDAPAGDTRLFVTIGKENQAPKGSEIHLTDIAQIATLLARLSIRQREKDRLREIQLRARTAEKFGPSAKAAAPAKAARLLWLGHDAPFLNAIKSTLAAQNVNMVAAISRLTAEDYLFNGGFQSLVLCPSSPDDEAARLLASVKTLQISHAPQIVLLLRPELADKIAQEHFAHADQIIDLKDNLDGIANRLLSISVDAEIPAATAYGLSASAQDLSTGLVSRDYLESHVEAQMAQADRLATPLSLLAIDISRVADHKALAHLVQSHLRDTDLAARLDQKHICLTLPNTQYRGAVILARRIEESIEGTVSWRAIERRQFHTLKTLLGGLTAKSSLSPRKTA